MRCIMWWIWILVAVNITFIHSYQNLRRVVGGIGAFDEAPWMIAMMNPGVYCGGVAISEFYILTVAECIHPDQRKYLFLKMAVTSLAQKGQVYWPLRFYFYNEDYSSHDIGMMRTKSKMLFFGDCFKPIQFSTHDIIDGDGPLTFFGWGGDGYRDHVDCLQVITDLYVIEKDYCHHALGYPQYFKDLQAELFCTEIKKKHKVGCPKDVGGPITDGYKLVGLLAAGNSTECGLKDVPDVFINVFYHIGWIHSTIDVADENEKRFGNLIHR